MTRLKRFLALTMVLGVLFVAPILGVFFGALSGWIVGLFFSDTILGIVGQIGIEASMWQCGAFLGFVGGFFKTSVSSKS